MIGMDMLEDLLPERDRSGRIHGVVVGVVTNNQDPDGLGRVKLKFPWLSDTDESNWARMVSPMAGKERGLYFLPEVDDEVLVIFEHGQVDHPFVLGALWNGKDKPPAVNEGGKNDRRVMKSRSGHTITLDDTDGAEKITIADKTGKNTIVLDAKQNAVAIAADKDVTIQAGGNITLSSSGGDVAIKCKNLSIEAQQKFALKASQEGALEASAGLKITCMAGVNVNSGALEVK
ncbi:VgrG protein [Minicystis rosea]|nr:VgrG protein [Minicystis rosea]